MTVAKSDHGEGAAVSVWLSTTRHGPFSSKSASKLLQPGLTNIKKIYSSVVISRQSEPSAEPEDDWIGVRLASTWHHPIKVVCTMFLIDRNIPKCTISERLRV